MHKVITFNALSEAYVDHELRFGCKLVLSHIWVQVNICAAAKYSKV